MSNALPFAFVPMVFIIILAIYVFSSSVKVLREYERAVVFRLGRLSKALLNPGGSGNGPGLLLLLPIIDKMVKVSMRTITMDVPSQDAEPTPPWQLLGGKIDIADGDLELFGQPLEQRQQALIVHHSRRDEEPRPCE